MNLMLAGVDKEEAEEWNDQFVDTNQWIERCNNIGFTENTFTKIYGELPAPDTDLFPYKNEMAQWMESYVFVSHKS